MASENKNKKARSKATFSVARQFLYPSLKTEKFKDATVAPNVPFTFESISDINPTAIKQIETTLKLTFLSKKDENSAVCMANSLEVRNEFKNVFDLKDLLNYSYAVLHSLSYIKKNKEGSKTDAFEVACPSDSNQFWKLVNLGAKLRGLSPLELTTDAEHSKDIDKILKEIAEIKIE